MIEINKIYCGNCIEIMKEIPDKSIDCIIADPPYEYISKKPCGGGFMSKENKKHFISIEKSFGLSFNPDKFLESIKRLMKIFNLYVFTNKNLLTNYINFAEKNNYKWDVLLWIKPNPVPTCRGHYLPDKEYILYIKESSAIFNSNLGYENYFTYFSYPIGGGKKITEHPTEKPIELIKRFISISSNLNGLVLDPFIGSGTTALAALQLNRNYIGIEISQEYVDIANKRINDYKQQLRLELGVTNE